MSDQLVSIIMGVYNCEDRINKCIESVQAQTYQNWELIICDDCSTDDSFRVLNEYTKNDPRIKVLRNERNSKLAYSLNRCLEIAKGIYIARMDDDDICYPQRLKEQVDFLNHNPQYDVVGSWADVYDGFSIIGIRRIKEIPQKKDLLYGPCHMHPTIMMRKEAYDALNGYTVCPRTERGQDWDLWFRFYAAGMSGYNLQESLIRYHESKSDRKKRTLKTAWMYTRTAIFGYKLIRMPMYDYIFAFKPLVSAIMPRIILERLHIHS